MAIAAVKATRQGTIPGRYAQISKHWRKPRRRNAIFSDKGTLGVFVVLLRELTAHIVFQCEKRTKED
jgi:hypothetical protein